MRESTGLCRRDVIETSPLGSVATLAADLSYVDSSRARRRFPLSVGARFSASAYAVRVVVYTQATVTCPRCGAGSRETMPENACQRVYVCTGVQRATDPESR